MQLQSNFTKLDVDLQYALENACGAVAQYMVILRKVAYQ